MKLTHVIHQVGDKFFHPVTLVKASATDQPLIYVNKAFMDETLYNEDQVLGKNCRFLQGALTDVEAVKRIHDAIFNKNPICQDIVNYKSNGEIFYNRLVLIPFREEGEQYVVGLQHVIPKEKFRDLNLVDQMVLGDKTLNPLTVMQGLLKRPNEDLEKNLASNILRLRDFVLGL